MSPAEIKFGLLSITLEDGETWGNDSVAVNTDKRETTVVVTHDKNLLGLRFNGKRKLIDPEKDGSVVHLTRKRDRLKIKRRVKRGRTRIMKVTNK